MSDDSLSDEDKALFRANMRSVKPLHEKTRRVATEKTKPLPVVKKQPQPVVQNSYFLSDYISEEVLSETVLSYAQPGLAAKRFKELRNGQIRYEAVLDLHGFHTEAARDALIAFIQQQTAQQTRCILIVHGKGGHSSEPPVIKNLIARWLPQFDSILAFHSARPKDGGTGAVYVLLKKNTLFA